MVCQACGQNTANTHIKSTVNGELTELHLCSQCASEKGYNSLFGGLSMSNLIGSFFGELSPAGTAAETQSPRCEVCGSGFSDIVRSGKVGCAACYNQFQDKLLPSIQRIHGNTLHTGKTPASMGTAAVRKNEIEELKKKLQKAVAAQDFESAAVLRDQINEKMKGEKHHD